MLPSLSFPSGPDTWSAQRNVRRRKIIKRSSLICPALFRVLLDFCHFFDERDLWRRYLDVITAIKSPLLSEKKPKPWNEICLHVLREAEIGKMFIVTLTSLDEAFDGDFYQFPHLDSPLDWHERILSEDIEINLIPSADNRRMRLKASPRIETF